MKLVVAIVISVIAYAIVSRLLSSKRRSGMSRLFALKEHEEELRLDEVSAEIDWARSERALEQIGDSLGKAGFYTKGERRRASLIRAVLLLGGCALGCLVMLPQFSDGGSLVYVVFGSALGLYLGLVGWTVYLKYLSKDLNREIIFQTPLVLESLILLVESGLGILPALQQVVSAEQSGGKRNPVVRLCRLVYELAASGMPFGGALELVGNASDVGILRHVFLHLDISGTEGGELIPSLRSLSDHAHREWKMSVEHRVKRLENSVVFPVFAAVIGLMLLTAAVPLVPVLELRESMQSGRELPQVSGEKISPSATRGSDA